MGYLVIAHVFKEVGVNQNDVAAKIERRLAELDLALEISAVDQLAHCLAGKIERRIYLLPVAMPPGFNGAWISDAKYRNEYIFYNSAAPPFIQTYNQLHQLGHLICGHATLQLTHTPPESIVQRLHNGSISPADLHSRFACNRFNAEVEANAMTFLLQGQYRFKVDEQ
jgi:hypothetical protein